MICAECGLPEVPMGGEEVCMGHECNCCMGYPCICWVTEAEQSELSEASEDESE